MEQLGCKYDYTMWKSKYTNSVPFRKQKQEMGLQTKTILLQALSAGTKTYSSCNLCDSLITLGLRTQKDKWYCNITILSTALSKDEILQNHASVLNTFNIPVNGTEEYELPYLYWIPKLHKNPYKQRYIAGSSKCSTKPVFTPHENIDSCQGATSDLL